MQFFKGSYTHADNSVAFSSITRTFIRGQSGRAHLLRVTMGLKGKIIKPTQDEIWTELDSMRKAYEKDGDSAGFNGTPFYLNNSLALGGVRVTTPISHGAIEGAEGTTFLKWTADLEADFMWSAADDILEFSETVSFTDNMGLPIYVERIPAIGAPILQQVTTQSWYYANQSGKCVQSKPNPTFMAPLFPQNIRTASGGGRSVTYESPKMIRGVPVSYGVNWRYDFVSSTPLAASPNALG